MVCNATDLGILGLTKGFCMETETERIKTEVGKAMWSTVLLEAVLLLLTGFYLLIRPALTASVIVMIAGFFALIGGIVDGISAIADKPHHWGWRLTGDIILSLSGVFVLYFRLQAL